MSQLVRSAGSSWFPPPKDGLDDPLYTMRKVSLLGRVLGSDASYLMSIEAEDILTSRVFTENMPDDEQQLDISQETSRSPGPDATA